MRFTIGLMTAGLILTAGANASAHSDGLSAKTTKELSNFMQIYGNAQAPVGFIRFCEKNANSCQTKGAESRIDLTADHLAELEAVNLYVNSTVSPASDIDLYGVREYWAFPKDRGDCEDYALLKQKLLEERGWPSSSLLITIVRDDLGEGHAILTVRTNEGDLILDNKVDEILLWNTTTYKYIMRQSYLNPRVWISLDSKDTQAPVSLAGVQTPK